MNKNLRYGIASFIIVLLVGLAVWNFTYHKKMRSDLLIADHVLLIAQKLEDIHRDCHIISFEHQANYVDFLNVISFAGSEVGPLNLAYPKNWKGPYLEDNPTMQEKYYQIVRTKKGYFVVPGVGVKLSNGEVIGTDIIFNEDTDIQALTQAGNPLFFNGRALAVKLFSQLESPSETVDDVLMRDRLKNM